MYNLSPLGLMLEPSEPPLELMLEAHRDPAAFKRVLEEALAVHCSKSLVVKECR